MGKLPAFLFYPKDWLTDIALKRCSFGARGMWMEMLCLMFECPIRGVFANPDGTPWSIEEIAGAVGGNTAETIGYLQELLAKGVAHRNSSGAIFSRRLVADETNRKAAAKRKQKARSCHAEADVTPDVTPDVTADVTADVTQMSRSHARCHADVTPDVTALSETATATANSSCIKSNLNVKKPPLPPFEGGGASSTVPDLPPMQLARGMCEELCFPATTANMMRVAAAIEALAREKRTTFQATYSYLLHSARTARDRGENVDKFWFEDAKWRQNGKLNKQQEREDRLDAIARKLAKESTQAL